MRFLTIIRIAISMTALCAVIAAIVWWRVGMNREDPPETPVVTIEKRPSKVPLRILATSYTEIVSPSPTTRLRQSAQPTRGSEVTRHEGSIICEQGQCVAAARPDIPEPAVSDGMWWYYYEREEQEKTPEKTYLRRTNGDTNETQTIMESTPLTSPRGLSMSPTGRHMAFWLDNIAEKDENLTELWVYDVDDGGVRLLAEKLYRPDVRSSVRWNSQGTQLWFIADTGEQTAEEDRLELIIVGVEQPGKRAAFNRTPWAEHEASFLQLPADLSREGTQLAFPGTNFLRQSLLTIDDGAQQKDTTLRGDLVYTQWLEDDSLLYAVQDDRGFTFWRVQDQTHRFVARRPGTLTTAKSDVSGHYVAFIVSSADTAAPTVFSMHIDSGLVVSEGALPAGARDVQLMHVQQLSDSTQSELVAAEYDDSEIVAFVERRLPEIIGQQGVVPLRLITTNEKNAVYIDYRSGNEEARILLKVQDVIHADWSIRARYEPVNREWKKVQGGGLNNDPTPERLYEWEEGVKQWILKERL